MLRRQPGGRPHQHPQLGDADADQSRMRGDTDVGDGIVSQCFQNRHGRCVLPLIGYFFGDDDQLMQQRRNNDLDMRGLVAGGSANLGEDA